MSTRRVRGASHRATNWFGGGSSDRSSRICRNTGDTLPAGTYVPPTLIEIDSIAQLTREVFGPVLTWHTFTSDDEVIEAVRGLIPKPCEVRHASKYDYRITGEAGRRHPIRDALREMGLWHCYSHEKFVPAAYLHASPAQRLAMLQGLMDTDGYVQGRPGRACKIEYSTTSPMLAQAVVDLTRSLGGKARVSWRVTSFTYRGERKRGRPSARVRVSIPVNPFRLARRASQWQASSQTTNRIMVAIDPAGVEECVCIAVDHPQHTYVTRDYVVTHNTLPAAVECARAIRGDVRELGLDLVLEPARARRCHRPPVRAGRDPSESPRRRESKIATGTAPRVPPARTARARARRSPSG